MRLEPDNMRLDRLAAGTPLIVNVCKFTFTQTRKCDWLARAISPWLEASDVSAPVAWKRWCDNCKFPGPGKGGAFCPEPYWVPRPWFHAILP